MVGHVFVIVGNPVITEVLNTVHSHIVGELVVLGLQSSQLVVGREIFVQEELMDGIAAQVDDS